MLSWSKLAFHMHFFEIPTLSINPFGFPSGTASLSSVPVPVILVKDMPPLLPCSGLPGLSSEATHHAAPAKIFVSRPISEWHIDLLLAVHDQLFRSLLSSDLSEKFFSTQVNVKIGVNGAVWVLAHSDIHVLPI